MVYGDALASGTWANQPGVANYRCEWLGETLVERITLDPDANSLVSEGALAATSWAGGVRDLVRFWLFAADQIVDKVFDSSAESYGYYSPVTSSLERNSDRATARHVWLGLHMDRDRRVTVTGEDDFDLAVAQGLLAQEEIEQAERRIRELTAGAASNLWPPPFVRNFAILKEDER